MHTCSGCSNGWSGINQCHCSVCHNTFSVLRNFDLHRVGKRLPLSCADPTDVGLVQNPRGIWKGAGEEDIYERLRSRTEE